MRKKKEKKKRKISFHSAIDFLKNNAQDGYGPV